MFEDKFWLKVDKTNTCWLWKAYKAPNGYGKIKFNHKSLYAHRVSWFLTYKKWPKNNMCHKCDNPACVRPDHLFDGTYRDNVLDAIKKGRWTQLNQFSKFTHAGKASKYRKLTYGDALIIRKDRSLGKTLIYLAKEYNVTLKVIDRICKNITYNV